MNIPNDISGKRYGRLVAQRPIKRGRTTVWESVCDCGNVSYPSKYDLEAGKVKSCGCLAIEKREEKFRSLIGKRFERLVVIGVGEKDGRRIKMKCRCDCGNIVNVRPESLKKGLTLSCGCYHKEQFIKMNTKHGHYDSRLYRIWSSMKQRCYNRNDEDSYKYYGARGIKVCDEWLNSFESFYNWSIENGYADNLTIDRIDTSGDYSPENCRWATPREQANNTRRNRKVIYNGESKNVAEWCREKNIDHSTLTGRIEKGMTPEEAIDTPVKKKEWFITYNGKTMNLTSWSKEVGISRTSLSRRIKAGWPVEKSLTTPPRKTKRSTTAQKLATPPRTFPPSSD